MGTVLEERRKSIRAHSIRADAPWAEQCEVVPGVAPHSVKMLAMYAKHSITVDNAGTSLVNAAKTFKGKGSAA